MVNSFAATGSTSKAKDLNDLPATPCPIRHLLLFHIAERRFLAVYDGPHHRYDASLDCVG